MTRVAVIGGGVTGASTAYALARRGFEVLLFEREKAFAARASYGNGAQLSYSYVVPLAAPGAPLAALKYMVTPDAPLSFTPRVDRKQWSWIVAFLRACNARSCRETTISLLRLSGISRSVMHRLVETHAPEFRYSRTGKLVLYRSESSFAKAKAHIALQEAYGHRQQVLDDLECRKLEPAIASRDEFVGGIFAPEDETGDCRLFTEHMAQLVPRVSRASRVLLGTRVAAIHVRGDRVTAVQATTGSFGVDAVVIAAGNCAVDLCRPLGIELPIYQLKGYSITAAYQTGCRPRVSITDFDRKMVFAPLGPVIRTAGFVELGQAPSDVNVRRVRCLQDASASLFGAPTIAPTSPQPWAGCRPATPSGMPIVGGTPIRNLYLNVGHGALGFTLAAGTAEIVAGAISGMTDPLLTHFAVPASALT